MQIFIEKIVKWPVWSIICSIFFGQPSCHEEKAATITLLLNMKTVIFRVRRLNCWIFYARSKMYHQNCQCHILCFHDDNFFYMVQVTISRLSILQILALVQKWEFFTVRNTNILVTITTIFLCDSFNFTGTHSPY